GQRGGRVRPERGRGTVEDGRGALARALGRRRRSIGRTHRVVTGYAASLVLVSIVVFMRWFVIPQLSLAHPYLFFYPAIIAAGWYGGFGPRVVATVLAAVAWTYLSLPPLYSLRIHDIHAATRLPRFLPGSSGLR